MIYVPHWVIWPMRQVKPLEKYRRFIQGRASITVGSMHYLAKVKQADEWYSRVADKLLEIFS